MRTMGEDRPRVGIGLPVHNGENYLAETLGSILAQTYSDFELVISDNASADRTEEICRAFAAMDERIRYFRNEENLGAAENFNRALELSAGKYFKWAAHDDLCAPEYLARCVEILDRQPEVVLCYPKTRIIDGQGEFVEDYFDGFHLDSPKPHIRFRDVFRAPGLCNPVFGLMRARILKRTGLIGNYAASDRVLLGELALHGQFYEVPEYLFLRRGHPQRSMAANVTDSEIAAWFDPAMRGKILFPRWRRLLEYLRAAKRAPLSQAERIRCYMQIGRFVLSPSKLGGMAGDLLKAVKLALRVFGKHVSGSVSVDDNSLRRVA
jgi:glycosyltransferase involved in cell wall biosynthesis